MKKYIFFLVLIVFLGMGVSADAASIGEKRSFYVDSYYDVINRNEITGVLQGVGRRAYFYVDENWWETLNYTEQANVRSSINSLRDEFDGHIYPILTKEFGHEWRPGIDGDNLITILIHPMNDGFAGYFNSGNEYRKIENPDSNEKEMVYLGSDYINSNLISSYLAHEFTHLITFNQKEKINDVKEDIWLNEARAEYVPTFLGYDRNYARSNLKERVKTFLKYSTDSLAEWSGQKADYGVSNLFIQYLVDHYGVKVLSKSLKSNKSGIDSLNYALKSEGFTENFAQIFTDWSIAVLINDCSLGEKYCYKSQDLAGLRINPALNFLPIDGKGTLGVSQSAKNWESNWLKVIGGKGTLKIEFIGNPGNIFQVPYLTKNSSGKYSLGFFELNEEQRGEILVEGFGYDITSIIIIPSVQTKILAFINPEVKVPYFWSASIIDEKGGGVVSKYLEKPVSRMSKTELLGKIAEIQSLLNQLLAQVANLDSSNNSSISNIPVRASCSQINKNMNIGTRGGEVTCLQEFLKKQGNDIYPEGLVTGYFGNMTKRAVIKFQEKYVSEILSPFNISVGTGYVGKSTLSKINSLLTP